MAYYSTVYYDLEIREIELAGLLSAFIVHLITELAWDRE